MNSLTIIQEALKISLNNSRESYQALPGGAQSLRELVDLLKDTIWESSRFEHEKIISIEKTENGYVARTTSYCMEFNVKYDLDQPLIGPVPFTIELDADSIEKQDMIKNGGMNAEKLLEKLSKVPCELYRITKISITDDHIDITYEHHAILFPS
ncbi:MAG: hypothetical protein HY860_05130 [Chlamydiales bacterium]|nr:hypothetical protein [Chlamydiales bacterium]